MLYWCFFSIRLYCDHILFAKYANSCSALHTSRRCGQLGVRNAFAWYITVQARFMTRICIKSKAIALRIVG